MNSSVDNRIVYKARSYFKAFHSRPQRYSIMVCHRRAGKTVASIVDLIHKAMTCQKHNPRFAYIAPFRSQAQNIAWNYLLEYTTGIRKSDNKSDLYVQLKGNKAIIRLFGADNPNALRGMYLDGVILDEYADFKDNVWGEVVRPTLADRKGWASFIGTPRGHNAFYDLWERSIKYPNDWYRNLLAYWDTGVLDEEEIDELKRTMSDSQFRQELCCDWEAAVSGTYYGTDMEIALKEGRIGSYLHNPRYNVYTAWDLGYTDSTAIWFFQVIEGKIYVIDYYENFGQGIKHYINVLKSRPYDYGMHYLPHDARQRRMDNGGRSMMMQFMEDIEYTKINVLTQQNILDGIQAVRTTLPICHFNESTCKMGIECLRLYKRDWDSLKQDWSENPRRDKYCHGADAFRYLAIGWEDVQERFEPDKSWEQILKEETSFTLNDLKEDYFKRKSQERPW